MLSSRTYTSWNEVEAMAQDWDRLVLDCRNGVQGVDATCSWTWTKALSQSLLSAVNPAVVVVRDGTSIAAIFATYQPVRQGLVPLARESRLVAEAYSGRREPLVRDSDPAVLEYSFRHALTELPGWDRLQFGVVEGSRLHAAIQKLQTSGDIRLTCTGVQTSPFIDLTPGWEAIVANLPKKMRWTIRKAEKDLNELGRLRYEKFETSKSVDRLLECIYAVEKKSWKESSGTSITTRGSQREFYECFVRLAALEGTLSAHVLLLNEIPIAYILGVTDGSGIFLDLKESFDLNFAAQSPGHVLKRFAFHTLRDRGVFAYDFMGECEPYKMRWTNQTYSRLTYQLHNSTIRGKISYLRSRHLNAERLAHLPPQIERTG
jgi:hypothetical protein